MAIQRLQAGDKVVVIAGKDKGKQGEVIRYFAEENRVLVQGINLIKRHMRPNPKMENGGILEREAPLHASNVMLLDPSTGKPTRVRTGKNDAGKKVRIAVKSGAEVPAKNHKAAARG